MATYYVSEADGSNTYDGLASTYQSGTNGPWRWPSYIWKSTNPTPPAAGDTVKILAGDYGDNIGDTSVWTSGTAGNVITIMANGSVADDTYGIDTSADNVIISGYAPATGSPLVNTGSQSCEYITWQGIIFDGSNQTTAGSGFGLGKNTHYWTIRNCEVRNCFYSGIGSSASATGLISTGHTISHCKIHNNGTTDVLQHHGVYMRTKETTLEYCDVYDNSAGGIQLRTNVGDDAPGDEEPWCENNIVRYCKLHDNGTDGLILHSHVSNFKAHNNLIYHNKTGGIQIASRFGGDNFKIYNNTVVNNLLRAFDFRVRSVSGIPKPPHTNVILANNLIYDHPIIFHEDGSLSWTDTNNEYSETDPQFTDYVQNTTWDLTLSATSPAIVVDAGVSLGTEYDVDFVGTLRPQGVDWDIGAYESAYAALPFPPVNVVPTETLREDEQTILTTMSVRDNNNPTQLLNEVRLRTTSTATFTKADISGGASLCA